MEGITSKIAKMRELIDEHMGAEHPNWSDISKLIKLLAGYVGVPDCDNDGQLLRRVDDKIAEMCDNGDDAKDGVKADKIDYKLASDRMNRLRGYALTLEAFLHAANELSLSTDSRCRLFELTSKRLAECTPRIATYIKKTDPQAELDRLIELYESALTGRDDIRDVCGHISQLKGDFPQIANYTGEMQGMLNNIIEMLGYPRYE